MGINDQIADRFITRSVNLMRFEEHVRGRVLRILRQLEDELAADVARANPTGPGRTAFQQARLNALVKQTRGTILTAYDGMRSELDRQLRALSIADAGEAATAVNRTVGVDLFSVAVPEATLRVMVDDALVQGAPAREWWSRQAVDTTRRFVDQMRMGMLRGETNDTLIQRVRGTRLGGYTDGVLQASRIQADALVRSSTMAVSNGSRMAVYRANDDVVGGVQALTTLDGRTTIICIARSGAAWTLDGKPLPGSTRQEPFPGYPPWHWRCRSTLVPLLKGIDELLDSVGPRKASALRRLPEGTQQSMDGQVAEDLTYPQWLTGKSEAFQRDVLGAGRFALWRAGKLDLHDAIDQTGRALPLDQLAA